VPEDWEPATRQERMILNLSLATDNENHNSTLEKPANLAAEVQTVKVPDINSAIRHSSI
jgi:hypothetical protein